MGFDAIGVTIINLRNDGSQVSVNEEINARVQPIVRYVDLIQRLAHLYATEYGAL